jgi:Protein of unknown function (DUF3592)
MGANSVGLIEILIGIVFLLVSAFFGYIAISMLYKNYKMATKGIRTTGVITGHKITRNTLSSYQTFSEEIEFQTLNGEKVAFVSPFSIPSGANVALRGSGTKVKILYNPKNPQDALDASFFHFWFFPLCILVAALGGFYLSFCLFVGINPP